LRLIKSTLADLGPDVVMIGIDVDPNEDAALHRRYVVGEGWGWRWAVAPRELVRALVDAYGTQFSTPPTEPMLVIDAQGRPHAVFGHKNANDLRELVARYRA
jgi:cytochrome oxidase Cu insertion factor (SCO1/SenC/PrrC family)